MSNRTTEVTNELYEYIIANSLREPEILAELRAETRSATDAPNMQIGPDQGQFMGLLAELTGAKRYLEVGTFTGYSALAMAFAMPADAEIVCCDVSEEYTGIARRYWEKAGVADRIDLRLAPALKTLDGLIDEGRSGTFDIMFIDADKENYVGYYERGIELIRQGGLIAVDNVLWGGDVADPADTSASTEAIRQLNRTIHADERVSASLVGVGDGLYLARKR
ncbi:MAG: class I SAM-dependent methyltransferase [Rhodospirillales bacterium]